MSIDHFKAHISKLSLNSRQNNSSLAYEDAFDERTRERVESAVAVVERTAPAELEREASPVSGGGGSEASVAGLSYFYQSADGLRIYINSLNTRCLLAEYGSYSQCPLALQGRVLACESFFMRYVVVVVNASLNFDCCATLLCLHTHMRFQIYSFHLIC